MNPPTLPEGYRLGPRIVNVNAREVAPFEHGHGHVHAHFHQARSPPTRIVPRANAASSSPTPSCTDANLCEKPISQSALTIPITLGVVIPLVTIFCVLIYLHRRSTARQKREDQTDPHKDLDFGLKDDNGKSGKRKSPFFGSEKGGNQRSMRQQLSMDMNLSSPYLLPPALQGSRESLHSMARSLHNDDPYRPVAQQFNDAASMKSGAVRGTSIRTESSGRPSRVASPALAVHPPRSGSLPKGPMSPTSPPPKIENPFRHDSDSTISLAEPAHQRFPSPPAQPKDPFQEPNHPQVSQAPRIEESYAQFGNISLSPEIQEPPPVAQKSAKRGLPSNPRGDETTTAPLDPSRDSQPIIPQDDYNFGFGQRQLPPPSSPPTKPLPEINWRTEEKGLPAQEPPAQKPGQLSPPAFANSLPASPRPARDASPPKIDMPEMPPALDQAPPGDYYGNYGNQPQDGQYYDEYDDRGRQPYRESETYPQYEQYGNGLAAPQEPDRRLSVGFRPLPPDEFMETEDPEERANRIRSFYKEYFDDSKPEPMPPMPQGGYQQGGNGGPNGERPPQQAQYYEDYDEQYLGEQQFAPFFDPSQNTFVMPYAQPVQRRAMTPPPTNRRFQGGGPRGPPRRMHGSMGGASLQGGRGPPPRPGSSNSWRGQMPPQKRPGSSASSYRSGRSRKPAGPPPAALTTLPTPSKLRDDSFAIMGAADFAPPPSFQERARGRSQSPMGERRPYLQPNVPVVNPLASSFDELSSLPSPHAMRKSSTFTGLDFAPPRRFGGDGDAPTSDAGSIRSYRSNKSGISSRNLAAIRGGAGQVSRLPGDTVFTQDSLSAQLKPQWGMRP